MPALIASLPLGSAASSLNVRHLRYLLLGKLGRYFCRKCLVECIPNFQLVDPDNYHKTWITKAAAKKRHPVVMVPDAVYGGVPHFSL